MKKYLLSLLLLLIVSVAFSQTQKQKDKITSDYNISHLQDLSMLFKDKAESSKLKALAFAKRNNWKIRYEEDGKSFELMKVSSIGTPIYYTTFNVNAAISTRANLLHNGGGLGLNLEGQNMTAHVWDAGLARSSHQEYDGSGGTNRFSIGDGTSDLHYHSAHVTGTIIASGVQTNAKGMAPQAQAIGYEWNNDVSEATTAASNGMLISNHSYGYGASQIPDQWFGAYGSDANNWDDLMYNAPYYLMVVAAGNDGNDNSSNGNPLDGNSSYDKLSGHATAKNNMVVANGQDASIDSNGNLISVTINSGSSEGPTDDYRIKPDITGNGTSLYSTYDGSDTEYNSISGTSMASPNVAGTLLVLQQHYENMNGSFMRSATLKGLALHTADEAGASGPDVVYGWGLMNAKEAANAITNNGDEALIEENILTNGQSYVINVESDEVNDLVVSISWTDPAGIINTGTNSSTPALVNDLDVRVTQGGNTSFPYKLTAVDTNTTGDNIVDPFERINIGSASGTYTITVSHKGTLSSGSQAYSLIVTGKQFSGVCNATTPTNLNTSIVGATEATLHWDNVQGATYELRYRETGATTWITQSTTQENSTLTGLSMLTEYEAQVRSICPDSSSSAYSSSILFTTTTCSVCASTYSNTSDDWISNVFINTIDNDSSQGGADSYEDFTAQSTDVELESTHVISVTLGMLGDWTSHVWAWVDWNQDCDFDDAGEAFDLGEQTNSGALSGNIIVPSGATLGSTTLRIIEQYNSDPSPCDTHPTIYGETEDYTINVIDNTDNDPPVPDVTDLPDITAQCEVTSLATPTATDAVAGAINGVHNASLPITTQGTTIITWTYDDGNGNIATQNQSVIIDDTISPIADVTTLADLTAQCEVTSLTAPTATDNCVGSVTGTHNATLPITVSTTVTWTYTDGTNTSTQTQTVTITDTTAPVADVTTLADITAACSVTVLTAPTATDNCVGSVTGTHNATLPITSSTTITWTFTDGTNTSTQTQNVVINDTTAPVADVTTLADITSECEVTSLTAPTATDNCVGSVTGTHNVTLPITSSTTITWTYTDGTNTSTQTQEVVITPIDNTVSQSGFVLTANASGYSYQWVDCNNGNAPISGATNQSYSVTVDGSYAVEISNGDCSVISDCVVVTGLTIIENDFFTDIVLYPNPTEGNISLDLGDVYEDVTIRLRNILGQIVTQSEYRSVELINLELQISSGEYLIEVTERKGKRAVLKLLVK